MATVLVKLDIQSHAVKLDPMTLDIDVAGVETIHWRPDPTGDQFDFVALIFHGKNPFFDTVVRPGEITSRDTNQGSEEHPYVILVRTDNTYYSSQGLAQGGGPTIRNN